VRRYVDTDRILGDEQPARAVAEHIEANRDAFFSSRARAFATEYEYRVVLATGDDDYACIDYGDSLVYVVVGERFQVAGSGGHRGVREHEDSNQARLDGLEGRPPACPAVRPPGPSAP
jgi:hypothetical protein